MPVGMIHKKNTSMFHFLFSPYFNIVENAVTKALDNRYQEDAFAPILYHFGWIDELGKSSSNKTLPGKGIRPLLLALTYDVLGGNPKKLVPLYVCLELLHNFSLIHDDIEDKDLIRHSKTTLWATERWGQSLAINAGDYLFVLALEQIRFLKQWFSIEEVVFVHEKILQTVQKMTEGQHMDLSFEKNLDVSVDDYLAMIGGKTGAMIELPIFLAAYLSHATPTLTTQLATYAKALGKIFQLRDDYLGIWGDEKKLGKSTTTDIEKRKKTYPVIFAFEHVRQSTSTQEKKFLLDFYGNKITFNTKQAIRVQKALEYFGAKKATEEIIQEQLAIAFQAVRTSSLTNEAQEKFSILADFFATRGY